jgi:hypothetical protein
VYLRKYSVTSLAVLSTFSNSIVFWIILALNIV